jgi:UPF0755 protein
LSLKNKSFLLLALVFSILVSIYIYLNLITNKIVIFSDTYYLLNKNTSQKKIISELRKKNIDISYINWKLASLSHKKPFIPKAGEYLIPKNRTLVQIQQILQTGKTLTRQFTLIEGSTAVDLKNNLLKNPYLTGEIRELEEGIYKPDTYFFKLGFPRSKLLNKMKTAQEKFLNSVWKEKPKDFVLKNKNELLILASIIQKESGNIDDSKLVASVFINRLNNKMKLQSDVTLAYGFKVNGKNITRNMLNSNNPYNTYKFHGLPPTPISYPGENALNTLRNIEKTEYIYFVSDGNGRHRFSKTYSLHKKNIKLWKDTLNKDK